MFKSIVVGTDGSANAEDALRIAAEFASRDSGATLHVVAAFKPLSTRDLELLSADLPEEFRPLLNPHFGVESILESARSILRASEVEAEFIEADTDPTEALLAAVAVNDADLIIVGSRGEGRALRALHGSVATKILHHAPCSVLVVKSEP